MTVSEAILTLNANVVFACGRAGFSSATVKMIEDALDTIEDALHAQEPRLVIETDFENADDYNYIPAWCEERIGGAGYWEMITLGALEEEDFRYWTSKPSLKQMEETPWN